MTRTLALLLLGALLLGSCGEAEAPTRHGLVRRAAAWLWSQQAADGGWHSDTYGLLGSGQSLTPFVLDVLLSVPPHVASRPEGGVARAVAFLVARVDEQGGLGLADETLADYPCYATALAVQALGRLPGDEHAALRARMGRWLLARQLAEGAGWGPVDAAYGSWGMGAVVPRPPDAGHVDLSMTRHVLEALAPLSDRRPEVRAARRAARHFLERVRVRGDDPATTRGFFFTTVMPDKNKAGPLASGGYAPYGTTNADGVLSLLAVGLAPSDAKVRGALAPLVAAHRLDRTPGPERLVASGWADATVYYYRAASAAAFARSDVREAPAGRDWRADLVRALAADQAEDGSFRNAAPLMKEDDPLIATTLALRALVVARP